MSGMIDHILTQDGFDVPVTVDSHGDQIEGSPVAMKCKFRYVTGTEKGVNKEALIGIDAIIWRDADASIQEGSIMKIDDKFWRVERLVKARKLSGDTVEFLKAYVQKYKI